MTTKDHIVRSVQGRPHQVVHKPSNKVKFSSDDKSEAEDKRDALNEKMKSKPKK
jgi:hypothetical protein